MKNQIVAVAALLALASATDAAPLRPVRQSAGTIPLAQLLGTSETLAQWKLLNGNGDISLMRVMSRNGGECGVSDEEDANTCPRYTVFVVMNGELSGPVDFTAFQLPETLGWAMPKDFKPDENSETTAIPLRACEMKRTAKGYGWRGVSYKLVVTEKLVGGDPTFAFSASLEKLPGERTDCADSQ